MNEADVSMRRGGAGCLAWGSLRVAKKRVGLAVTLLKGEWAAWEVLCPGGDQASVTK